MKTALIALALSLLPNASHALDFDGCYQLLDFEVMYPAICLSGTNEEGIGGGEARMAVFHTNTDKLEACLRSTALKISSDEFVFEVDGRRELVLSNFTTGSTGLSGDAQVGQTKIGFVKLSNAQTLLDSARAGNCN